APHHRVRPRPVGDETLHQPGVGQDVQEDVAGPLRHRGIPVVVHILIVPSRDGRAHHERRRHVNPKLRQLRTDHRRSHTGSVSSSSIRTNEPLTGSPISTSSTGTSTSSANTRTPSTSSTSATTNGISRPGTGGW